MEWSVSKEVGSWLLTKENEVDDDGIVDKETGWDWGISDERIDAVCNFGDNGLECEV